MDMSDPVGVRATTAFSCDGKAEIVKRILTGDLNAFEWATEETRKKAEANHMDSTGFSLTAAKTRAEGLWGWTGN